LSYIEIRKIMSHIFSPSFNSLSIIFITSALILIALLLSSHIGLSLTYAQSDNLKRPITSKVVPSNFTAVSSDAAFNVPITSKVVPSNFNAIRLAISTSYAVTNATITFSYTNMSGEVTKGYTFSPVNSSNTIISGIVNKGFVETS
jgi:hypothetical protein